MPTNSRGVPLEHPRFYPEAGWGDKGRDWASGLHTEGSFEGWRCAENAYFFLIRFNFGSTAHA